MDKQLTPGFSRRRYSNKTFTWVYFKDEDGEVYTPQLDPYDAVTPSKEWIKKAEAIVRQGYYHENKDKCPKCGKPYMKKERIAGMDNYTHTGGPTIGEFALVKTCLDIFPNAN